MWSSRPPIRCVQGLDTGTPVVQIGSLVFKGRYEPAILGTTMVFEGSSGKLVWVASFLKSAPLDLRY